MTWTGYVLTSVLQPVSELRSHDRDGTAGVECSARQACTVWQIYQKNTIINQLPKQVLRQEADR